MSVQIIPFDNELLSQAAALLAARHRCDRAALPLLPKRFEDTAVAGRAIEAVCAKPHAAGFAAMEGEHLLAYLIGDVTVDAQRGRAGWVRSPGCAYDPQAGVDIVRDLYAALGERWTAMGVFSHFVLLSVADEALIQAWFSLSFGIEQVHALLNLSQLGQTSSSLSEIELRQAGPGDEAFLAAMSDVIWREQVKAPVWGAMLPEAVAEVEDGWAELADDHDCTTWLAMAEDGPVGVQVYWPADVDEERMHMPDKTIHLGVAGTRESMRGRGVGTWMTATGLAHAADAGYAICETDWRSTNLFSSRFWPNRGFGPVVYRLVRNIDPRISWATGLSVRQ